MSAPSQIHLFFYKNIVIVRRTTRSQFLVDFTHFLVVEDTQILLSLTLITSCNRPYIKVKPIFHCDTYTFALGPRVGLDPQREILRWLYQHVGI